MSTARILATGLVAGAALSVITAANAAAAWSPARTFAAAHRDSAAVAVNGRGDAAVAWTSRKPARMRVTVLRARHRPVTRVVSARVAEAVRIVLDDRAGVTVAWTVRHALYVAHGSPAGHWSAPQRLASRDAWDPQLAVAPDRRVLLAWTNAPGLGPGSTGVAWRLPGHRFSRPLALRRPAPGLIAGEAPQSDNGVAFDARGRAYVWSSCDGVVRIAPPHSRRLGLATVAPGRVLGLSVAVTGTGRGFASWADSRCTIDPSAGSEPGPMWIRPLQSGAFGDPQALQLRGTSTQAFALAGDGGLVTAQTELSPDPVVVTVDDRGAPAAVMPVTDRRLPFAADGGGNLMITAPGVGFVVRPRSGADEPFDKGGRARSAAAAPNAPGFGVVWDRSVSADRLSVSLWSPSAGR